MKKKTARRWINRNRWKKARFNLGMIEPGTKFHKQLLKCERANGSILFRRFN